MQQSNGAMEDKAANKKSVVVGSTWSNVNIDLDNLLGKKDSKGLAPSMNQLKSANTSPTHQQKPPQMVSPLTSPNSQNFMGQKPMFFNAQQQQQQPGNFGNFAQENNNNNFNRFNAFQ